MLIHSGQECGGAFAYSGYCFRLNENASTGSMVELVASACNTSVVLATAEVSFFVAPFLSPLSFITRKLGEMRLLCIWARACMLSASHSRN